MEQRKCSESSLTAHDEATSTMMVRCIHTHSCH
jgi:hypothetical protein